MKKIVFTQRYIDLSMRFSENPESLSMAKIEAFQSECTEALDTEDESSSSRDDHPTQRKKPCMGMLAPSKPSLFPTNPYNQAWQLSVHFKSATRGHTAVMHPHYHISGNMSHNQSFRFGSPIPSIASFQQPFYQ